MNSIKTQISVIDTARFKLFLAANHMCDVIVGDYAQRHPARPYQLDNLICYAYSDSSESVETLMYLTIKYGSLEAAYVHFRSVISQRDPMPAF